jgi:hypothetical protein
MSEPTNFDRAKRAAYAVESYAEANGLEREDPETNLTDLMADLLHMCRFEGWDHYDLFERAKRHFWEEVIEEDQRKRNGGEDR